MSRPVLLVNSVTFALKGHELLKMNGISSRIIRNTEFKAIGGCGYGLMIDSDPMVAQNILMRGGIKVIRIIQGGNLL